MHTLTCSRTVTTGASEILGLEAAGIVSEVGKGVSKFKKGDKVYTLLDGGGYADYVVAPEGFIMPLPKNLSFVEAAGIPEVCQHFCCPTLAQHVVIFIKPLAFCSYCTSPFDAIFPETQSHYNLRRLSCQVRSNITWHTLVCSCKIPLLSASDKILP